MKKVKEYFTELTDIEQKMSLNVFGCINDESFVSAMLQHSEDLSLEEFYIFEKLHLMKENNRSLDMLYDLISERF